MRFASVGLPRGSHGAALAGGPVAALTSSLPETPGGERKWDYRYGWIHDSTFLLIGRPPAAPARAP